MGISHKGITKIKKELPIEVTTYLQNKKRQELAKLKCRHKVIILLEGDPGYPLGGRFPGVFSRRKCRLENYRWKSGTPETPCLTISFTFIVVLLIFNVGYPVTPPEESILFPCGDAFPMLGDFDPVLQQDLCSSSQTSRYWEKGLTVDWRNDTNG